MNILRFKHHVLRDSWGTGGSDGSSGSMNSGNNGGGNDSTAWGGRYSGFDPNTPNVDKQYIGNSGNFGTIGGDAPAWLQQPQEPQKPVEPTEEEKAQQAQAQEEQARQVQAQQFALNKMNFDEKNPNFVQGLSQMPQMDKSISQMFAGSPQVNGFMGPTDIAPKDRERMFNAGITSVSQGGQLAKDTNTPLSSIFGRELNRGELGTLSNTGYGGLYGANPNNMQGQSVDNMIASNRTMDTVNTVGQGLVSAMMPAPMRLAISGIQAYQNYQKNPDMGVGRAVATGLQGAGGYTGALANLYNKNYGAALTGALGKNGITGNPAAVAGMALDYGTGKNIAPSIGGLAGQFVGRSIGGSGQAGANLGTFGKSLGQQMSRRASIRK